MLRREATLHGAWCMVHGAWVASVVAFAGGMFVFIGFVPEMLSVAGFKHEFDIDRWID